VASRSFDPPLQTGAGTKRVEVGQAVQIEHHADAMKRPLHEVMKTTRRDTITGWQS